MTFVMHSLFVARVPSFAARVQMMQQGTTNSACRNCSLITYLAVLDVTVAFKLLCQGRSRDFSRGGGGSHSLTPRVLTGHPRYFWYRSGVGGGGGDKPTK